MNIRFYSSMLGLSLLLSMFAIAQETPPMGEIKKAMPKPKDPTEREGVAKSGSLEDLIAQALKTHPDIRVAAAKVRSAEVKLQEVREEYLQERHRIAGLVAAAFTEANAARTTLNSVKARLDIAKDTSRRGGGSLLEVAAEEANVVRFQADFDLKESTLKSLLREAPSTTEKKATPKPKDPNEKDGIEGLIDQVLKTHPDIRVAAAKLKSAEAKLQEAREEYLQEQHRIASLISGSFAGSNAARSTLKSVQARLEIAKDAMRRGVGSMLEVAAEEANVARFQAELDAKESTLKSLLREEPQPKESGAWLDESLQSKLGKVEWKGQSIGLQEQAILQKMRLNQPNSFHGDWSTVQQCQLCHMVPNNGLPAWQIDFRVTPTESSISRRIRAALDKPLKINQAHQGIAVNAAIEFLQQIADPELPIRFLYKGDDYKGAPTVDLMKAELSFGAWLQVIEDTVPDLRLVVREYGILVTDKSRVPEGAVYLHAFWKHKEPAIVPKKEEKK